MLPRAHSHPALPRPGSQVLCGNIVNGGLDATTPVSQCSVYLMSADITNTYNQLAAAAGRRRLRAAGRRSLLGDCPSCIQSCVCNDANDNCFPGDATAIVEGAGAVRMDRLAVGDRVLTLDAQGRPAFEEARAWRAGGRPGWQRRVHRAAGA